MTKIHQIFGADWQELVCFGWKRRFNAGVGRHFGKAKFRIFNSTVKEHRSLMS